MSYSIVLTHAWLFGTRFCNRGEILEVITEVSIEIQEKSEIRNLKPYISPIFSIKSDHVNLPCAWDLEISMKSWNPKPYISLIFSLKQWKLKITFTWDLTSHVKSWNFRTFCSVADPWISCANPNSATSNANLRMLSHRFHDPLQAILKSVLRTLVVNHHKNTLLIHRHKYNVLRTRQQIIPIHRP